MAPASGPRLALSIIIRRSGSSGKNTSGNPVMTTQLAPAISTKSRLRTEPTERLAKASPSATADKVNKPPSMADHTAISDTGMRRIVVGSGQTP